MAGGEAEGAEDAPHAPSAAADAAPVVAPEAPGSPERAPVPPLESSVTPESLSVKAKRNALDASVEEGGSEEPVLIRGSEADQVQRASRRGPLFGATEGSAEGEQSSCDGSYARAHAARPRACWRAHSHAARWGVFGLLKGVCGGPLECARPRRLPTANADTFSFGFLLLRSEQRRREHRGRGGRR